MIVDELKISILEKAIKGELVNNNSNNMLIEEELNNYYVKYNGIAEINKKPDFEIPGSWRWVKLDNITFSNIGLTYKPINIINDGGTIVLRSNNIKDGKLLEEDFVRVDLNIPENKMCHPGDILMCSRNGSKKLVGKCAIIDKEGYSFGAFMAIIRSDISKYLYYLFNSSYFRKKMLGDASTTTINQITQKMLAEFWIPLPPLEEQERIVNKIDELFKKLDTVKPIETELINLKSNFAQSMKESILFYYLTGLTKNNLISIDKYNEIKLPTGWKWENFANLADCRMGKTILARELIDTGVPVYSATNTDTIFGYVQSSDLILNPGDIVIPARGNSIGCATIINDGTATCTQTTIACYPNEKINNKYLYYCCYAFKKVWFKYSGSAIPQITISGINNNYVPLPPIEEQQRIVEQIEQLLPLCDDINNLVSE